MDCSISKYFIKKNGHQTPRNVKIERSTLRIKAKFLSITQSLKVLVFLQHIDNNTSDELNFVSLFHKEFNTIIIILLLPQI